MHWAIIIQRREDGLIRVFIDWDNPDRDVEAVRLVEAVHGGTWRVVDEDTDEVLVERCS